MLVLYWIIMPSFLFLSFIMIMLVLIQKGRGGGLSARLADRAETPPSEPRPATC